jgi:hypothetical protein
MTSFSDEEIVRFDVTCEEGEGRGWSEVSGMQGRGEEED